MNSDDPAYIVLPTYNERENLPRLAERLLELIPGVRLLVVDDASPDGTGELADALARQHPERVEVLHRAGKQGLGTAYKQGFVLALERGAGRVVQMDCDFSHPPEVARDLLQALDDCDVAIGSRYVPGGGLDPAWPWHRRALSRGGNAYIRLVLGLPIADITTGFAAYRAEVLRAVDLSRVASGGFVFQAEIKTACHRLGFRMKEVPFVFMNRRAGESKIGLPIILEALWKVWVIRFRGGERSP